MMTPLEDTVETKPAYCFVRSIELIEDSCLSF
jgi:hypothetical protein